MAVAHTSDMPSDLRRWMSLKSTGRGLAKTEEQVAASSRVMNANCIMSMAIWPEQLETSTGAGPLLM